MQVNVSYLGGMKFSADCAKHKVIIDLPLGVGGTDQGATPPQLFLSSIASCIGVYVASYCRNAELDAQGMQIIIKAEKASNPNRLDNIKVEISLPHANIGQRREAILAAAKKCLIHQTIKHDPAVDVVLV